MHNLSYHLFKGTVSCYKDWLPTNEAVNDHMRSQDKLNSQMLSIIYSIVSNIVFSSLISMLVSMSLQSVLYCLPTPSFSIVGWETHCRIYDQVGVLAHQLPTYRPLLLSHCGNFHSIAACCKRWSTWPSPISSQHQAKILVQCACSAVCLRTPVQYTMTLHIHAITSLPSLITFLE